MKTPYSQSISTWGSSLLRKAIAETGLSNPGDADYVDNLRRLLAAYESDAALGGSGRARIYGMLSGIFGSRLYSEQGWRKTPICLSTSLSRPIFITGLPRTGTTALHKLLSIDPQFQGVENWLLNAPAIRPDNSTWTENHRYQAAQKNLDGLYSRSPALQVAHEQVAGEVDECSQLLAQTFCSNLFGSLSTLPSFDAWFLQTDLRPAYRRYANNLRLIGHADARRWLLKDPSHLLSLDALLDAFPDALIVQTHRDPAESIGSICSLYAHWRIHLEGRCENPHYIGSRELSIWREAIARSAKVESSRGDFEHVLHRDFSHTPIDVVRKIYRRLGAALQPDVETAMTDWLDRNPRNKHGRHHYSLEDFGLTTAQVRSELAGYISRFDL